MDLWADGGGDKKCSEINFSMGKQLSLVFLPSQKGEGFSSGLLFLVTAL